MNHYTSKRSDYLNWDEYFMAIAKISSLRSKDPHTQVGCCIVNNLQQIEGTGYNGFPRNVSDDNFPWGNEGSLGMTKYPYVMHAETNAIVSARKDVSGCTLYCTHFPCYECVKVIIQSGIKKIIFESKYSRDAESENIATKMLEAAQIITKQIHINIEINTKK